MKKTVLNAIPTIFVLALILIILYATGIFGVSPSNPILSVGLWVVGVAYALTLVFAMGVLLMEKGNPVKTLSWLVVLLVLPGIGMMLYNFFGANFREEGAVDGEKTPAIKLAEKYREIIANVTGYTQEEIGREWLSEKTGHLIINKNVLYLKNDPQALLVQNTRLQMLVDGEETYDQLLDAIESARDYIHLEYFIWKNDDFGKKLRDILIKKSKEGVTIRIIFDGVGSKSLDNKYIRSLEDSGIQVNAFRPLRMSLWNTHANFRNHRKIAVMDGKVAFTGGINIDGKYLKEDNPLGKWRDTHLRVEGDAVLALQMIFLVDWFFLTEEKLMDEKYFPRTPFKNQKKIHIVASDHQTEWDGIKQAYLNAFYMSKNYLYMSTPYFAPNDNMLNGLKTAANTGVDVRLIIPEEGDSTITQLATMSFAEEMLMCGVRVFRYKKGFIHSKVMMADDEVGTIGTANLDLRSMDQNLEVNAFFYDKKTIGDLKAQFLKDQENSEELKMKYFEKCSVTQRIKLAVCRLFAPLL